MKKTGWIFVSGLLFGTGLTISGMIDPSKVIGFLDIFGNWDPSLAFVMLGAILVTFTGFKLILRREVSWFKRPFQLPTSRKIDARLIIGAILFGIGWGLVGLCPGPALAVVSIHPADTGLFVITMLAGMYIGRVVMDR